MVLSNDSVVEAWHQPILKGGRIYHHEDGTLIENLSVNHTPGTKVDLYSTWGLTDKQVKAIEKHAILCEGMKYDFRGVFRFLTRVPSTNNGKLFCSELVAESLLVGDIQLQKRVPVWDMSPKLVGISPVLTHVDTIVTM